MFDDRLAPVTAHPAAPGPATPPTAPVSSGDLPGWSSRELTALVEQLARVELDVPDAERIDQLTALERVKAACAAAQARITDRFVDSQAELAAQWHQRAQDCSDASDFDGWCTAREQARRHEFAQSAHGNGRRDGRGSDGPGGDGPGGDGTAAGGPGRGSRGTRRAGSPGVGVAAQVALARRESRPPAPAWSATPSPGPDTCRIPSPRSAPGCSTSAAPP